jgi:hypothetical protein
MYRPKDSHQIVTGLTYIFSHSLITLLAIGIAFMLPIAARYILYQWWPRVETDAQLLLFTEIGCAFQHCQDILGQSSLYDQRKIGFAGVCTKQ